jgi:hypothetical protein
MSMFRRCSIPVAVLPSPPILLENEKEYRNEFNVAKLNFEDRL